MQLDAENAAFERWRRLKVDLLQRLLLLIGLQEWTIFIVEGVRADQGQRPAGWVNRQVADPAQVSSAHVLWLGAQRQQ